MNIIKTRCSSNNVTRMRQETKPIKIEKNSNSKLDFGVGKCATPIFQRDLIDLLSPSRYKIV
jgi:hypothetical protein